MNTILRQALALFAVPAMLIFAGPAQSQTTSNGPYYALPAWDQSLPPSSRYIILNNFNSEAALDRETGLVWERNATEAGTDWAGAMRVCVDKSTGGRKGWRAPTIEELMSIFGPSGAHPGSPFDLIFSFMWSSSTVAGATSEAWASVIGHAEPHAKTECCGTGVLCVRGGQGHDGQ